MSDTRKIWFITGISRGFGRDVAAAALADGDIVIGTTRSGTADLDCGKGELHVIPLELTDKASIPAAVERAFSFHGRLDVILNNAGYGFLGTVEEATEEEIEHVMAVDFYGPLAIIRAALPRLRAQRGGHILNITSIAGLAPMAGSGYYAAAKFAVEGLTQSLAQELAPIGIKVTLVEPGAFRTDFLAGNSIRVSQTQIEDYKPSAGVILDRLASLDGKQPGDPLKAAAAIVQVVRSPKPPLHLVLGSDAIRRTREKQRQLSADMEEWEGVGRGTDYPA